MRVLLVANTLPPRDLSGVGEQVLQLAAGLEGLGHEVRVLGRGPGGARGSKLLFPITAVPAVLRELRWFRPHVLQVHESDGALAALLTAVLGPLLEPRPMLVALLQVSYAEEWRAVRPLRAGSRILGRPTGAELRFRWLRAPLQAALGCLTAWLADRVLAPSRATAEEIARDYGVGRVEVLPNVSGGLPVAPEPVAPDLGQPVDFLFVGRLRIRKGVQVLLHALVELLARGWSPRLVIAGDGEQLEVLRGCAAELGLEEHVRFLGRASGGQVRELLRRARALVVPSTYEGMPLVILEAMESAVPVVASRVCGIPEVVMDGETGWLVDPESPTRLAAALAAVLQDPEEAECRGEAGRQRLSRHYRPEVVARRWLQLIEGIGDGTGGSGEEGR